MVAEVEPHRVEALEPLHPEKERFLLRPNDQVEMVAEEAPGNSSQPKRDNDVIEEIQEQITVSCVEEDPAARVPGDRDQVNVALGPDTC